MDDRGKARVLYPSTNTPDFGIGRIRSAEPLGADWIHLREGAIVAGAPGGFDLIAYRNPFVRREGDLWRMFVGAAGRDGTAMALTYVSEDPGDVALRRSCAGSIDSRDGPGLDRGPLGVPTSLRDR